MKQYKQKIAETIGKYGCYYLCLIYLAEKITGKNLDPIFYYTRFVNLGWMEEDCFLIRPDLILSDLVGNIYTVFYADLSYRIQPDDLVIVRYEWAQTMTTLAHFVVLGKTIATPEYDPLGNSQTVEFGKPVSYRILRRQ